MNKRVKGLLIICFIIAVIVAIVLFLINILNDNTRLSSSEKEWINNNTSTVINVNITNDLDVFGSNGNGLFYSFLSDLGNEYGLKINNVTYNHKSQDVSDGFMITNNLDDKMIMFYEDNYVLVSKDNKHINKLSELNSDKVGILSSNYDYVKSYISDDIDFVKFDTDEDLKKALGDSVSSIVVPKYDYMNTILSNDYYINYHFGDIKTYYVYKMKDDYFSSILKKYYSRWNKNKYEDELNNALFDSYVSGLKLSNAELTELNSKVYNYGFINNSPYEIISSGSYGGIVSIYLKRFSDMTGVDFKYTKYRTYKLLTNAINDGNVDLYYNYYTLTNDYSVIDTNMNLNYVIIANDSNPVIVNSIKSLMNKTVYVLQDSYLYNVLKNVDNITINTYKNIKDLKKLAKNDCIVIMDSVVYWNYAQSDLKDYSIRYTDSEDYTYNFKSKNNGAFYKVFNAYVKFTDANDIKVNGIYSYNRTSENGTIIGTLAKYILYILGIFVIVMFLLYKSTKRIKISRKIKKEEKMKYIDQLTSLKNRNYLSENISAWNKNTIYPQAMVVIDLNRVQEINDTLGYEKGDTQIKACANVLIKNQLDNTDVMRTDGNEFLVYMVGYDERKVVSYMKKLNKEFKNLPYEYGAAIGHSMILNGLKSIEDAVNEAVEDMKNKKNDIDTRE